MFPLSQFLYLFIFLEDKKQFIWENFTSDSYKAQLRDSFHKC